MSTSRTESQQPFARRRSNTAQSILRHPTVISPLKVDDSTILNSWVHDPKECPSVVLNFAYWPGVAEGDMIHVTATNAEGRSGFLFIVPQDEPSTKHHLQVHHRIFFIPFLLSPIITYARSRFLSPSLMHSTYGTMLKLQ
jgi:hypothetical protein